MGSARPARREPKNPKSCHERALGLLAVRPRSRRELERRLLQAGFEPEEVQDTLGRLERVGLIDDAAQVVRDRKSTRLNSSHSELSRMPSSA